MNEFPTIFSVCIPCIRLRNRNENNPTEGGSDLSPSLTRRLDLSVLLDIQNLETRFHTREGYVYAVNGASLRISPKETLGIVGESGCGKSVTMMSILGLVPMPPGEITGGKAFFKGADLLEQSLPKLRQIRGKEIGFIFQDPMTSFNPVLTIGRQILEPLREHSTMSKRESLDKAKEILNLVGISNPGERLKEYPHQFSGGMRQRAMIAMALIRNPSLLIADEPTTALDVTIQAQIVELVNQLKSTFDMSIIWITHDLGVIAGMADRVAVMYGGMVVEEGQVDLLYEEALHPYTRGLLESLPKEGSKNTLKAIKGSPMIIREKPSSCPFEHRCSFAKSVCGERIPPLKEHGDSHRVACWLYE